MWLGHFEHFRAPRPSKQREVGLFPHHQDSLRMSDFAFLASQKSSFSTGFIRFFDMAGCHVVHSEKPNAFLIISGAILRFGLQND